MDFIKRKNIYFTVSGILTIISILALIIFGLKFSIDLTGGSRIALTINNPERENLTQIVEGKGVEVESVNIDGNNVLIRMSQISQEKKDEIVGEISTNYQDAIEESFETVGPTIGQETQINAIKAVLIAALAISIYVAIAFRKVSKPVASWKYGATTILTLLHDVIVVIGLFAIFGKLFSVEVDALFITALLTVMGFSVHDTIVVFDRIRENLKRNLDLKFSDVVNNALAETFNRSLNTSITVGIVLVSLILFGGDSIRWFVVALFAGIIVGTYSSIFIAAPLLVAWNDWDKRKKLNIKPKK